MRRKNVTRRDALGMIGKAGITLSTGPFFFLSLKTAPLAADFREATPTGVREEPSKKRAVLVPAAIPERVVISGAGSKLRVKISGPVGRHCGIVFATSDKRESYKAVTQGRDVIGEDGVCIMEIETRTLPNQKVLLRVVTGSSSDFSKDARGTKAFEVLVAAGVISQFVGVRERPTESAAVAVSAASFGYQSPTPRTPSRMEGEPGAVD